MMIRGAIFDVDGTILDSMPVWYNAGNIYLESLNKTPEEGLSQKLFSMALNKGAEYINEYYGLNKTKETVIKEIVKLVEGFYHNEVPFKNNVDGLLKELYTNNIPMTIATAGDISYLGAALSRLGVEHYFKKIFTCVDLNTTKDEPYIFNKAAELLNCRPEEIYVFEDSYQAARTAKNAGYKVVGIYDRAYEIHQEELKQISDLYIKDYNEINLRMLK